MVGGESTLSLSTRRMSRAFLFLVGQWIYDRMIFLRTIYRTGFDVTRLKILLRDSQSESQFSTPHPGSINLVFILQVKEENWLHLMVIIATNFVIFMIRRSW